MNKRRDSKEQHDEYWQGKSPDEIITGFDHAALNGLRAKLTDWTDRIGDAHSPGELQKRLEILIRLEVHLRDVKYILEKSVEMIRKIENAFAPPSPKSIYIKAFTEINSQAKAANDDIEERLKRTISDGCPNWAELYGIEMIVGFLRDTLHYCIGHIEGVGGASLEQKIAALYKASRTQGIGQKIAKADRVAKLSEKISRSCKIINGVCQMKKTEFIKMMDDIFVGAEHTPRRHETVNDYKTNVQKELSIQIKWVK